MIDSSFTNNEALDEPRVEEVISPSKDPTGSIRSLIKLLTNDEKDKRQSSDDIGFYLEKVCSTPPLTREEEYNLTTTLENHRNAWRAQILGNPLIARELQEYFLSWCNNTSIKTVWREEVSLKYKSILLFEIPKILKEIEADKQMSEEKKVELLERFPVSDRWIKKAHTRLRDAIKNEINKEELYEESSSALHQRVAIADTQEASLLKATELLVMANTRLVVKNAKKYRNRGVTFLDLVQEGNTGLLRATQKFKPRLGWKFSTYATWWVKQRMVRAIEEHDRTITIPVHLRRDMTLIRKTKNELSFKLGHNPTMEELVAELDSPKMTADNISKISAGMTSIDIENDQNESWGSAVIADTREVESSIEVDRHLLRERIEKVLKTLISRDREIIELRFGLRDGNALTLEECALILKVTRERIRQIEARALKKLRLPKNADLLKGFIELLSENKIKE